MSDKPEHSNPGSNFFKQTGRIRLVRTDPGRQPRVEKRVGSNPGRRSAGSKLLKMFEPGRTFYKFFFIENT